MPNILLRYTPASPGRYEFRLLTHSVKIKVGYNHVTDSELKTLQENKFFNSLIEQDLISVEVPETVTTKKTKKTVKEDPQLPDQDPSDEDLTKETI